jgi:hypothetical protein
MEQHGPGETGEAAVDAVSALSEALEVTEEARGALYRFHRLTGKADGKLDAAIEALHAAGAHDLAAYVAEQLRGRDVLEGRWTFQIVEEYDDRYYAVFREVERRARDELVGGRRHVGEARMKAARQGPAGVLRGAGADDAR